MLLFDRQRLILCPYYCQGIQIVCFFFEIIIKQTLFVLHIAVHTTDSVQCII